MWRSISLSATTLPLAAFHVELNRAKPIRRRAPAAPASADSPMILAKSMPKPSGFQAEPWSSFDHRLNPGWRKGPPLRIDVGFNTQLGRNLPLRPLHLVMPVAHLWSRLTEVHKHVICSAVLRSSLMSAFITRRLA